jgi:hypothetical protein
MPRKKANRTKTEMEERYGIDFEYDYRIEAVEMYLADPNPNVTMIAEKMGVSRNTIGNFVNRPEIKEALYLERERRHKLCPGRNESGRRPDCPVSRVQRGTAHPPKSAQAYPRIIPSALHSAN